MAKTLLVTGAEGFTGRYLINAALGAGYSVHALVREEGALSPAEGLFIHPADICKASQLSDIVRSIQPEHVVHLAAVAFVAAPDSNAFYSVNVAGTRNLLGALAECERRPASVLLASSANIYGNRTEGAISESAPFDPVNDYAVSKVAAEYVARLYAGELPIIITRPFNYTGVGQSSNLLVPKIVDHVRRRAAVIRLGRLDIERDYSDVRTVADRYLRLLGCDAAVGQAFNICSGQSYALRDIVDMACGLAGHRMKIEIDPALVREKDVRLLRGDPSRLQAVIGEDAPPPFAETLRWMIES